MAAELNPAFPAPTLRRGGIAVLIAAVLLAVLAGLMGGPRHALLAPLGLLGGIALYHASFGFTAAWRRFILERRSAGLRAQALLLGLTSLASFPLLAAGSLLGSPVGGFVLPIGVALLVGAFIFGIGMQLGGGCGSGTLFTVGGGSVRMVVTLAFFILGSTLATAFSEHWMAWPALPPVSVIATLGWLPALVLMLSALAVIFVLGSLAERARHGTLQSIAVPRTALVSGPWSLIVGAVALAAIAIAILIVQGWPWGITSAFALWGSKIAALLGFSPSRWAYWQGQESALAASVFADTTSVLDFGIILGAMLAAMLAGKFRPVFAIPSRSLAAAILGGLLLGIGARLGSGCNIGAFFSGTISGSLHGWVWLAFAFAGNIVGVRLRPLFRLD